jgi:hypothetical protein
MSAVEQTTDGLEQAAMATGMGISTGGERVNPEDVPEYETPQIEPVNPLTHEQLIEAIRKLTAEINDRIEKRSKLRKAAQKIIGSL